MLAHSLRISNLVRSAVKPEENKIDPKYSQPKEKSKPVTVDPDVIVQREIRESVGKIDPQIKRGVETCLKNVSYKRKTKIDVLGDVSEQIEKRLDALRKERFSLEQYPVKKVETNPILSLNPDVASEDKLMETEVLRAYNKKDTDKLELLLLKSKTRLEELEDRHREANPSLYLSNVQGLDKSTASVIMSTSQMNSIYDNAMKKSSRTNSSVVSPYLTGSTSVSANFSPAKSSVSFSPSRVMY